MLKRHRNFVRYRIGNGDLEQDTDGNLSIEDVEALAEELHEQSNDPAVDHLKSAYELQLQHNRDMHATWMKSINQVLELQQKTIESQRGLITELTGAQTDVYKAHREIMLASDERKAAAADRETTTQAKERFMGFLEGALEQWQRSKTVLPQLKKIFETLEPEQMLKLAEVLDKGQLGLLTEISEALNNKTEVLGDAVESAATAAE